MTFPYARVKPDAFSDISDVQLRNNRIQQDILNQKRNWEAQQAAAEFEAWQKQNARKDYGYYDKGLAVQNGFRTTPFVGQAPSIQKGLASLGITPEGKLTFGTHGSNMVNPFRSKHVFKTDENGNVAPLSEDEKALLNQESNATEQQAAMEAASGSPVAGNETSSIENQAVPNQTQEPTSVESRDNNPWYDFLKYPKNTPYEQQQMRNQAVLRDAAIAAAMTKPIFYPEADSLSEPMANLAGQQSGLAQSAMQQYTARQGMAQNLFGQGANLITTLAGKSLESDLRAETSFANAQRDLENSKIRREQAEKLFKDYGIPENVANKIRSSYGTPQFLEVVKSKELEKYQNFASQYDALLRDAAYLENSSNYWKQRGNAQLSKSSAYMQGASDVDKKLEIGLNIKPQDAGYQRIENFERPSMEGQGGIGQNIGSTRLPSYEQTQTENLQKNNIGESQKKGGLGNLAFVDGKVVPYTNKNTSIGTKKEPTKESDPILKKVGKLLNKDLSIANFRKHGVRDNLDSYMQANADNTSWQKDILSLASELSSSITKDNRNAGKYRDVIYPLLANEARYQGVRNVFEKNPNFNLPKSYGLRAYEAEINQYRNIDKTSNTDVNRRSTYRTLYNLYNTIQNGGLLSKGNVDTLDKILRENFYSTNALGNRTKVLANTGLKIKAIPVNELDKNGNIKKTLYRIDLDDSFE